MSFGLKGSNSTSLHQATARMEGNAYLTTHSAQFVYGYMVSRYMVKDHSDSESGNPLPPHGLLMISRKGSFICIIPYTG